MKEFAEFERIIEMKVCDKRNHEIHEIHENRLFNTPLLCIWCISWFVMICAAFSSYAGAVEATSPVFGLSVKHDGVRQRAGVETLTYSSQWDGGDGATVTIA